jgi:hypothetical protein
MLCPKLQQQPALWKLSDYGEEADGREAQSHQGRASTPEASSYDRGRCMASKGCAGLFPSHSIFALCESGSGAVNSMRHTGLSWDSGPSNSTNVGASLFTSQT